MRKVLGFEAPFVPTGLVPCASGPLFDAAFGLMTTDTARQNPRRGREAPTLTTVAARAMTA